MEMHKYVKQDSEVEQDMTPMIDVVFLLIIFFMVVTELSNLDIVDLVLPVADQAQVEEPTPGGRTVTVNIRLHEDQNLGAQRIGQIVVGGEVMKLEELQAHLKRETRFFDKWEPNPANADNKNSLLEINLRADFSVNAGHIHQVYKACQSATVYKVHLASLNEALNE